jgi:hypothetical protein
LPSLLPTVLEHPEQSGDPDYQLQNVANGCETECLGQG